MQKTRHFNRTDIAVTTLEIILSLLKKNLGYKKHNPVCAKSLQLISSEFQWNALTLMSFNELERYFGPSLNNNGNNGDNGNNGNQNFPLSFKDEFFGNSNFPLLFKDVQIRCKSFRCYLRMAILTFSNFRCHLRKCHIFLMSFNTL